MIAVMAATEWAAGETAGVAPNTISGAQYLSALIGVVVPILVGIVTTHATNARFKALLLAALSALNGFLSEALIAANGNTDFMWQQALYGTVLSFVVSTAALYGLWKPTGVDDSLKKIGA